MEENDITFKNNEAFFRLFLKDEPWDAYRSNMSNWLSLRTEDGIIRKRVFINAINQKLGLKSEVWNASEAYQKKAIRKGVQYFKKSLEDEGMFSWLEEEEISHEQEAFLAFVQKNSVDEIESLCMNSPKLFEKNVGNQRFLLKLFHQMYERGAYRFLYEHLFPSLLDSYDNRVKSRKADVYAFLPTPMYKEAFEILNSIKGENRSETINLRTAAISNIRREKLSSKRLEKDELKILLHRLIKCYHKIYTPKEPYSYYPGINLAYMVAMVGYLFPDEAEGLTEGYSFVQIYSDVKQSLHRGMESENKEEQYYAGISNLEFRLLLGQTSALHELEIFLEELQPPLHQVNQTRRQMGKFFLEVIDALSSEPLVSFPELEIMNDTLRLLDAYIEAS